MIKPLRKTSENLQKEKEDLNKNLDKLQKEKAETRKREGILSTTIRASSVAGGGSETTTKFTAV